MYFVRSLWPLLGPVPTQRSFTCDAQRALTLLTQLVTSCTSGDCGCLHTAVTTPTARSSTCIFFSTTASGLKYWLAWRQSEFGDPLRYDFNTAVQIVTHGHMGRRSRSQSPMPEIKPLTLRLLQPPAGRLASNDIDASMSYQ